MRTDDGLAEEIRLFGEHMDAVTGTMPNDSSMNLLKEVSGRLPEGKQRMLAVVSSCQELPDAERLKI